MLTTQGMESCRAVVAFGDRCGKGVGDEVAFLGKTGAQGGLGGRRTRVCGLSLDMQMDPRHNPARVTGFVCLPSRSL